MNGNMSLMVFVIIALAIIIFFEPVMLSTDTDYLPEYIDPTYLPYVYILLVIALAVVAIFSLA